MSRSAIIGLDVGGTKVAGGLLTASNELLSLTRRPTLVDGVRDPGLQVTRRVAEELLEAAGRLGLEVAGIGAGFPEYVDREGRLSSHEVLAWTEQPAELLADLAPVTVDSDVRCAALGEGVRGAAVDLDDYAFVVVGTGLSHALIGGGRARRGARGEAIGLGELEVSRSVDASTSLSLERYASGEGIRGRYAAASGHALSGAADVLRLASEGDELAASIVTTAAAAVGAGLATLVSLTDPGALVVGGGVASSQGRWREQVERTYAERASRRPSAPSVIWASLGSDAGIIGAAVAHRGRVAAQQSTRRPN